MLADKYEEKAIALFSDDGENWSEQDGTPSPIEWEFDPRVTRIVIGSPDKDETIKLDLLEKPGVTLEDLYPNLTHLHLWGISNLIHLHDLPLDLVELDVRNCLLLEGIDWLPGSLSTLILKDNPKLRLGTDLGLTNLKDLDLAGCSEINQLCVNHLLSTAPNLTKFDASYVENLQLVERWPDNLTTIKLNFCGNLRALPSSWPQNLYRLELAGASRLQRLADFPQHNANTDPPAPYAVPDYLNLCHTHSLKTLPEQRGRPRSLFLYDSGLRVPPATEHGSSVVDNVASKTNGFFDDCELYGVGSVQRCKVQLLGNGRAGKTTLAMCLTGADPRQAEVEGSTHGVRFHSYDAPATIDGFSGKVNTNIWDFGGQEIYHGTHRLFMSKGSVFVVLWHADQDGKEAPREPCGFQDEWRPLQYWIDLIYATSKTADIVVVCSHRSVGSEAIVEQYKKNLAHMEEGRPLPPLYFIDSLAKSGQLSELEHWLGEHVGRVIEEQGQAVPSYWELAQQMVKRWLEQLQQNADEQIGRTMEVDTFRVELAEAVAKTVKETPDRFPQLSKACNDNSFELTEDRLRRTLGFLTNSGWLFWSENLFGKQVIIDQQWALRGLYDLLDRRKNAVIYRQLILRRGIFTQKYLAELIWTQRRYTEEQQNLLLSYMEECDLAFKFRDKSESWIGEEIYVSYEHLPTAAVARLEREFTDLAASPEPVKNDRMFRFHWQRFLMKIGSQFGADANYAKDGLSLHTKSGASALVLYSPNLQTGVGGSVQITTQRDPDRKLFGALQEQLLSILPRDDGLDVGDAEKNRTEHAERTGTLEVFISYTKNDGKEDYEETKRAIVAFIDKYNSARPDEALYIKGIIDERDLPPGSSINNFMRQAAKSAKVLVLHNDKYLRSDYAIYELAHALKDCSVTLGKSVSSVIIPIDNNNQFDISIEAHAEKYEEYWQGKNSPELKSGWDIDRRKLRRLAINAVYDLSELCGDASGGTSSLNIDWNQGDDQALRRLAERLGIPYPDTLGKL